MPIFFLEGLEGRMFRPLAFTKTSAMAFASLLSITLVPVLSGFSLQHRGDKYVKRVMLKIDANDDKVHLAMSDSDQSKQEEVMFAVRIQWLPVSLFERLRATVGGTDREGAPFVSQAMRRRTVLTGFDLRFTNGGHKLQSIGLNNQDSVGSDNWLRWSDSNTDDPIRWEASYRLLADGLLPDSD